ncbi:NAD(+) diphosphatase [Saliniradius amylolyticus]|uniref:NAD(+) diphosphatase n=1 Tax=Saliniradius amylolyticus TaxID=2183582 RepID=A0A2S2E4F8_9ALTE|nr:NAD(+) diphosphatase [Saliniradius amylolyticus]AWL12541.1 NAD(+) diphosphatase [Saliniradius amylolyticus]
MWRLRQSGLQRFSSYRYSPEQLSALIKRGEIKLSVFNERLRVLMRSEDSSPVNGAALLSDYSADELIFLGLDESDTPCFSAQVRDDDLELDNDADWQDLRLLLPLLSDEQVAPLAQAKALHHWHQNHRYCGRCGARTKVDAAGHERYCAECESRVYPRTDPAVIMAVTHKDRLLLARQPQWPPKLYSVLAGFVEPGESFEQTVAREVAEEVGLDTQRIDYLGSQPWPFPCSVMIGFYAGTTDSNVTLQDDELEDAFWLTAKELEAALREGSIELPVPGAISYALIQYWAQQQGVTIDG